MKNLAYLKNMTILLAEDDEVVSNSLANVLNIFVKEVIAVQNGRDALNIYKKKHIDIVILDIDMPYINGIDVAKEIRKNNTIMPIFITTAFNDVTHLHEAIPLMLTEYLIKPSSFDKIQKTLFSCVEYIKKQGTLLSNIDKQTTYNMITGELFVNGSDKVILPRKEKKLLDILLNNKSQLVKKEYLESYIFDLEYSESSLKNLVYRLKKRFQTEIIVNVKELGYMVVLDA